MDNNVDVLAEFLLTPLREGRPIWLGKQYLGQKISTHAPAGGATAPTASAAPPRFHFYSRPCGRGDTNLSDKYVESLNFYSRPCGRGDYIVHHKRALTPISTHAPAGGATRSPQPNLRTRKYFYSRPCGRGDAALLALLITAVHFYSRPCGRGDAIPPRKRRARHISTHAPAGGATGELANAYKYLRISTHAPAGGATRREISGDNVARHFYSRPCGRGDQQASGEAYQTSDNFYSRPCGRGD